jgi:hypothetical protein
VLDVLREPGALPALPVSDYVKPISQCRPEWACIKQGEPLEGGKGNGGGGGVVSIQPTCDQSGREFVPRTQRRDFQVSKRGFPRGRGRDFQATKRGYQKRVRDMQLHVYIVLIKDCVYVINKPCVRDARYVRLISWTYKVSGL